MRLVATGTAKAVLPAFDRNARRPRLSALSNAVGSRRILFRIAITSCVSRAAAVREIFDEGTIEARSGRSDRRHSDSRRKGGRRLKCAKASKPGSTSPVDDLLHLSSGLIDAYRRGDFIAIVEAKRGFYAHICRVVDNDVALVLLSRLTLRTAQLRSRSVVRPERQAQSIKEIEVLGRAIKKRDIEAARRAAKAHVDHAASSALPFAAP